MAVMKAFSILVYRLKNDQRGTALIELAVVLPVLLAICLGVFEFGNAIYGRHLIENGVRDAARYAAGFAANDTTARANAANIAVTGAISGGSLRVSWWNPTKNNACDGATHSGTISVCYTLVPITKTNYCGTAANPAYCRGADATHQINLVTVYTDVPYTGLGFLGYFGLSNLTMHVEHVERLFSVR